MESFEQAKTQYHFEEFNEIEAPMIELVRKLKGDIDSGNFDTLLGDDVGGRIPTLVLNEVYHLVRPDDHIKTRFVAGGYYFTDSDDLLFFDYLKKILDRSSNILFITQYIAYNENTKRLVDTLKHFLDKNISVASLRVLNKWYLDKFKDLKYFFGTEKYMKFSEKHEGVSLVRKYKNEENVRPFVGRVIDVTKNEGRILSPINRLEIYGITDDDTADEVYSKYSDLINIELEKEKIKEPLTDEEKTKMNEDIKNSREDVKTLAKKVVKEVWGLNF